MKGMQLRIYTYESRKHGGLPVHEWLLQQAKAAGIAGGSVFRAIAGFGRHGRMHEQSFFELAGEEPVIVEFIAGEGESEGLLETIRAELPELFVVRSPVDYGPAGEGAGGM